MNNEIYTDQVLDDYLSRKVNLDEVRQLLCREPDSDPSDLILLHQAAAVALQRNAVFNQVNNVHAQFVASLAKPVSESAMIDKNHEGKVRSIHLFKWALRVAAVLILGISAWYAWQFSSTSSGKLYSEMYQSYNVNTDRAGIGEVVPHNMISQYKDKDYKAVIATYNSLPVTTNREKFLTAMAYHETGQYLQSIDLLAQILKFNQANKSRLYTDEAEFYSALNYLKLKNGKAALPWFQKIYNTPTHTFNERVSKWIITRLKWLK